MKTLLTLLLFALAISGSANNSNEADAETTMSTSNSMYVINGTIIDAESKESLAGVRVVCNNADTVTYTDFNGKFSIMLPENKTENEVSLSYISYEEATVTINGTENPVIEISQID